MAPVVAGLMVVVRAAVQKAAVVAPMGVVPAVPWGLKGARLGV